MAIHSITHECGHTGDVELFGKRSERDRRAEWLAGIPCDSCLREEEDRERAEASARNAEANRAAGLPELSGSPKQVAWAETLRANVLAALDEERDRYSKALQRAADRGRDATRVEKRLARVATARGAVASITSARWFIDNRSARVDGLVRRAASGELRAPTAEEQVRGFDPHGLNRLTFPAAEVKGTSQDGQRMLVRLTHSRWEGCVASLPLSMTQKGTDGEVTVAFGGDWNIPVGDGGRTRYVAAADFHADRTTHRRVEPGERHYWGMPRYRPGEWNEFDVPDGLVSVQAVNGVRKAMLRLECSRWEGLHFNHPLDLIRRRRPGFTTVLFPSGWGFSLLGGKGVLRVGGQEMHEDRAHPLPGPGPSLAVEQPLWHTVRFHPSRVRRVQGRKSWLVRFPGGSQWPKSVVLHRESLCRQDGDGWVEVRFPDYWSFRVLTPDSGAAELSAAKFMAAVEGWAGTAPRPGTYVSHPDPLDPAGEVEIPDDLLEDDPSITGED
ncbi:hypothetical protein [Streptomyces sp. NPDC059783]|uniref:hypothetical protein n=1 Tax=Streptomyces sp. NPDC059783 TaxID=3346944 RepID=UPI00365A23ED